MNLEKEKEQYRSIQAPVELKMKIMQQAEKKRFSQKPLYLRFALVCCLIVISFALIYQPKQPFSIYVNQQRITQDMQMLSVKSTQSQRSRIIHSDTFEIKVAHKEDYTITANEGDVRFDQKDKEVLFWTLPENMTQKEYKLQLIGNTRSYEVIVRYDSSRDCWFIQYKEMKK